MELKEEDLLKEFGKDFYRQNYLAKMNIPAKRTDMSAIIPTYNRCPFGKRSEDYKYNPLSVCIKALLLQKSLIKEIVVVDDASTDNTRDVVKELEREAYSTKGVEIKYIYNKERKGSSVARNIGAKQASGKYLFFFDDDCVPAPYLSFISMIVIKKLEVADKDFSVLVLPVYDRASYPRIAISADDLSRTFFKKGIKGACFNSIPSEYLKMKDKFINNNLKILKPIKVYQTWGHFIIDRKKYLDVGGFPEFATWPNKAGEEQEFACRLLENAYTLYYLPGTKASSYHGAFGAKIGEFKGVDWLAEITGEKLSLIRFSRICNNGVISGNRVGVEDFIYSRIIASFCIIYKRNIKEAINWARKSYEDFVVSAKRSWFILYPKEIITEREKRERIWYNAINDGLNLLFDTETKKLQKLNGFIASLRTKGRIEEERRKNKLKEILEEIYKE